MLNDRVFENISASVREALARSPARDLDKNVRAALNSALGHLDLVTREEFEIQKQVLARTREKVEALEMRVAELEARRAPMAPAAAEGLAELG
jgi:BMFP domain-containing protein YqiC